MKRLHLMILTLAVLATPLFPAIVSASEERTEWWWYVIEWLMEQGGSWNLW